MHCTDIRDSCNDEKYERAIGRLKGLKDVESRICFGTGVVTASSQKKDIFSVCKNKELINLKKMELKYQYQGNPRLTALTGLNVCSAKKIQRFMPGTNDGNI